MRWRNGGRMVAALGAAALGAAPGAPASHVPPGPTAELVRSLVPCSVPGIPGPLECGTYSVWEDREARSGRTVDLHFVVARATGSQPEPDPIVFFDGGPGAGGTRPEFMGRFTEGWGHLRSERDFVFLDQRGTGASNGMPCPGPFPGGEESLFGTLFPADHLDRCAEELSVRADLRLYSTSIATDDADELLEWLGYAKVNLAGFSYGTRMALTFLQRHPDRVRTVHINGVAPNGVNVHLYDALNVDRALERFVGRCATCSSDLAAKIRTLAESLERSPAETTVRRSDGSTATVHFDRGDFGYALRGMLYGALAHNLQEWTAQALSGDWSAYATYYRSRSQWTGSPAFATGMHLSVFCAEDVPSTTEEEISRLTEGTILGASLYRRYEAACRRWQTGEVPEDFHDPVRSSRPALVVSGERDPATPPVWGELVAGTLSDSRHLVVPGAGHVPFTDCVLEAVTSLIRSGATGGMPTSCPAR